MRHFLPKSLSIGFYYLEFSHVLKIFFILICFPITNAFLSHFHFMKTKASRHPFSGFALDKIKDKFTWFWCTCYVQKQEVKLKRLVSN